MSVTALHRSSFFGRASVISFGREPGDVLPPDLGMRRWLMDPDPWLGPVGWGEPVRGFQAKTAFVKIPPEASA